MGPSFLATRIAVSFSAPLVSDKDPRNQLFLSLPLRQICKLPHLCGNSREQERRKKGEKSTHMPTNWKKNNPGLVSLSCWLAAPSHCGGCSCLLDRDLALCRILSHPQLAFVNTPPPTSAMGGKILEPRGKEAGVKD